MKINCNFCGKELEKGYKFYHCYRCDIGWDDSGNLYIWINYKGKTWGQVPRGYLLIK